MSTIYKNIKKVWFYIEENLLVTLVIIMGVDILIQIFSRRLFNYPISFTEELARYIQIWVTFMGMGLCLRRGEMIRATFIYDRVSKLIQHFIDLFSYAFMFWVSYTLLIPSWTLMQAQRKIAWDTLPNFNLGLVYICEPIGFAIISIYLVVLLYHTAVKIYNYIAMKGER